MLLSFDAMGSLGSRSAADGINLNEDQALVIKMGKKVLTLCWHPSMRTAFRSTLCNCKPLARWWVDEQSLPPLFRRL